MPHGEQLHELQEEMINRGGSQCGYCTAGQLMSMRAAATSPTMTVGDIEDALDGNYCRCTGYRPIVASAQHFERVFVERRGITTDRVERRVSSFDWIDRSSGNRLALHRPRSIDELLSTWKKFSSFAVELVGGATGVCLLPRFRLSATVLVSIGDVKEMHIVERVDASKCVEIDLGAAITIGEAIARLQTIETQPIAQMRALWKRVGNTNTRNVATIGGNLVMRRRDPTFSSDLFASLAALDASVDVVG